MSSTDKKHHIYYLKKKYNVRWDEWKDLVIVNTSEENAREMAMEKEWWFEGKEWKDPTLTTAVIIGIPTKTESYSHIVTGFNNQG